MRRRRRAVTLVELLVSSSLLVMIGLVTTVLYGNAMGTIQFTTSRSDTKQILRQALSRLTPMLQTAYIPTLPGATTCYETPVAPYPSGVSPADPLAPKGPGCNSFLFYTPVDLLGAGVPLGPPAAQQTHLFEVRLQETLEPDRTQSGGPALILRSLVLQERGLPASFGVPPFPLISGRTRVLARRLSDFRVNRLSGYGMQLRMEAQSRQRTLTARGATVLTNRLAGKVYFPVLLN